MVTRTPAAPRKPRATRSPPTPPASLSREAWIVAALGVLGERGVEAVRVEPLARTLAVTKGSFYWHFADRRALLDAMVAHWELMSTTNVITVVEAGGGSGADRLRRLIALCFRGDAHDPRQRSVGGGDPAGAVGSAAGEASHRIDRLENALRSWASTDDAVRPVLARVDAARIAYVAGLLVDHGLDAAIARIRARLLYLAMIGEFTWSSHGGARTPRRVLEALGELLLTAEP